MKVYGMSLVARHEYFSGNRPIISKSLYRTKEAAEAAMPAWVARIVTESQSELRSIDPNTVESKVMEYELVD